MLKTEKQTLENKTNIEKGLTPLLYKDLSKKIFKNGNYITFKKPLNIGILNALLKKENVKYAGCHSFVKTISYENNDDVGFCFSQENCIYSLEEVEKYVKILQKIGFNFQYEFIPENEISEALPKNFEGRSFLVKDGLHCFSISEIYNSRKCPWVRYIVFTMLRSLMGTANFYFPKRLIHFYEYFSKPSLNKKITLNEIFLFSLMCNQNIYEYAKHEKKMNIENYMDAEPEMYLSFYAYYGFFGYVSISYCYQNFQKNLQVENVKKDRELAKKMFIFSGLLYNDNFNFMEYLTNLDKIIEKQCSSSNKHSIQEFYFCEVTACFDILIVDERIKEKLNYYLKKGFYFMAFKYVKKIIKFYYDSHPKTVSYVNAFFKQEKKYSVRDVAIIAQGNRPPNVLTTEENQFLLNLNLKKKTNDKK